MGAPRADYAKNQDKPPSRHVHVSTNSTRLLDAPGLPEGLLPFGLSPPPPNGFLLTVRCPEPSGQEVHLPSKKKHCQTGPGQAPPLHLGCWAPYMGLDLSVKLSEINNRRNRTPPPPPPPPRENNCGYLTGLSTRRFLVPQTETNIETILQPDEQTPSISRPVHWYRAHGFALDHMSLLLMRAVGSTPLGYLSVSGVS
ncbi:hypothetical protein CH63R_01001 [Colletotrichum higginsianum IMI 349063]|uniref:Uncharacterized protein n=1 Tax=Colletotrichum higginsianum (strain IMI 349063) TaxID=759273 RepID=A0A1B7YUU7_COLHI|nr:hypothetical protein CH63R_01001 [Colletotrichum higginsianum IMI 349063]OBR15821.1 hypothetical protein CH63R_01001 [Colletotrichum higginsianum IMI 349063]